MSINYIVTTRKEILENINHPIIMLDGTVPKWQPRQELPIIDYHFDHHKPNGSPIQFDQELEDFRFLILDQYKKFDVTFVTTMVDADACVAAAFLQLTSYETPENKRKLKAIAYDCDHLAVPEEYEDLADFAAQAVAAMKADSDNLVAELGLNSDRRSWSIEDKEKYASAAFKRGTQHLIDAVKGKKSWPGENGEAAKYWETVEGFTQQIIDEKRITVYRDCLLFDAKGMGGKYIDPRCWLKAAAKLGLNPAHPVTLTRREVIIENEFKGFSYTLGTIPFHPEQEAWDYTSIFPLLTLVERKFFNPDADGWGGRKTVGGSGWNTPTSMPPETIIDFVLAAKNIY